MTSPSLSERIEQVVAPSLEAMGFDLVRVQLTGSGGHLTLQIMAEPLDGRAMNVDDCAEISRAMSALLDVEDPIAGSYSLEISSPGIDRPLVRRKDFERFAGYEVKVQTHQPIDGRKKFRGRLGGIGDAGVRIESEQQNYDVPFEAISKAKLVLTDELLAAAAKAQEPEQAQTQVNAQQR